jgi:hypothetical protein
VKTEQKCIHRLQEEERLEKLRIQKEKEKVAEEEQKATLSDEKPGTDIVTHKVVNISERDKVYFKSPDGQPLTVIKATYGPKDLEVLAKEEDEIATYEAEAEALTREVDSELAKAQPALDESSKALASLKKDDFYVLAGIRKPTPTVVAGMELACQMLGKKPKKSDFNKVAGDTHGHFETARSQLLSNPGAFLKSMQDYDKEKIPEKVAKRAKALLESDDLTIEKAHAASEVLVAIPKWSSAMVKYHEVLKAVAPKRLMVKEMTEKVKTLRLTLAEKSKKTEKYVFTQKVQELIEAKGGDVLHIEDKNGVNAVLGDPAHGVHKFFNATLQYKAASDQKSNSKANLSLKDSEEEKKHDDSDAEKSDLDSDGSGSLHEEAE